MAETPTMEVRARLTADNSQFVSGMQQATAASEKFLGQSRAMQGAVNGVGLAFAGLTAAAVGFGIGAFQAAARVDELDIALQAVGNSSGLGYETLNKTAYAVKAMGIETAVAQKAVLTMVQNHVDLKYATDLARASQDLAVISQKNSTEVFDTMNIAIQTQNAQVLRSIGVNTTASQAFDAYGATIGKSGKALTQLEQKQAIVNAILKDAATYAGVYELAMTKPGKVLRSFPRLLDDIKVSIGSSLLKGFGPMIYEIYRMIKAFDMALQNNQVFKDAIRALGEVFLKLTTPITNIVKVITTFFEKTSETGKSMKYIGGVLTEVHPRVTSLANAFEKFLPVIAAVGTFFAIKMGQNILSQVPIFGQLLGAVNPLIGAMVALAATSPQIQAALGKLLAAFKPLLGTAKDIGKGFMDLASIGVSIVAKAIEGLARIIKSATTFLVSHKAVLNTLTIVLFGIIGAYALYRSAMMIHAGILAVQTTLTTLQAIATGALTAEELVATVATGGLTGAMASLALAMEATGIPQVVLAIVALVTAFVIAYTQSEKFREVFQNVFNFVAKIVGNVLGFVLKMIGQVLIAFGNLIDTHNTFGQVVAAVFQFALNAVMSFAIFFLKMVVSVLKGFINLFTQHETFAKIVETVINFVIKAFLMYYKTVLTVIRNILQGFVDLMEGHSTLRKIVENVINTIIRIFILLFTQITVAIASIIKVIASLIHVIEIILDVAKVIVVGVVGAFFALGKGILEIIAKVVTGIGDFLESTLKTVKDWVTKFLGFLMKIPFVSAAVSLAFNSLDTLAGTVTGSLDKVGTALSKVFTGSDTETKKTTDAISGVSESLIKNAESWGNYKTGVSGALSGVANSLLNFNMAVVQFGEKDNGGTIVDALIKGAKAVVPVLDGIIEKIDTALQINYGGKIVEGLVSGAKTALAGVQIVLTEVEKLKDKGSGIGAFVISKTSEKAIQAGNFLINLATGIEEFTSSNTFGKLEDVMGDMMNSLKTGLGFGDILNEITNKITGNKTGTGAEGDPAKDIQAQADQMKRIREAMAAGIDGIKKVIDDLASAAKDFANSLKDVIVNFAGLKGVDLPDGFVPQAKSLIENMRMKLDKAQQFAVQIATLQSLNLDAGALKTIIEEGPIKGAQIAASIIAGGQQAVDEISRLQKAITFTGAGIGAFGADVAYSDLIANANAKLGSITAQSQAAINQTNNSISVSQGAVNITVSTAGLKDATEIGDVVVKEIERVFGTLAKELAAK